MPVLPTHSAIVIASDEHCIRWHQAEVMAAEELADQRCPRELRPVAKMYWELPTRRQDEIRARVEAVLTGEVRVSEMGPGDRAIYHGLTRLTAADDERIMNRFRGDWQALYGDDEANRYCHRFFYRDHWYDFLELDRDHLPIQACNRVFGNAHIGYLQYCNLYCPGMLASDQSAILSHWYLTLQGADDLTAWADILAETRVTLVIGERPHKNGEHGIDLWKGPRSLRELMVPVRQNVCVQVDFFGKARARLEQIRQQPYDPERPTRGLFIHLDGYRARLVA